MFETFEDGPNARIRVSPVAKGPPETFFPSSLTEDEPPQMSHLSRKLLRAQQEKLHRELYDVATGPETAFLTVTSHKTCGDFLFAPLTDPYCRMTRTFKIFTRLYLGLEVTSNVSNIGECNGTVVHPFGAHGYHAPGKITNRHYAIRDCISSFISFQALLIILLTRFARKFFLMTLGMNNFQMLRTSPVRDVTSCSPSRNQITESSQTFVSCIRM